MGSADTVAVILLVVIVAVVLGIGTTGVVMWTVGQARRRRRRSRGSDTQSSSSSDSGVVSTSSASDDDDDKRERARDRQVQRRQVSRQTRRQAKTTQAKTRVLATPLRTQPSDTAVTSNVHHRSTTVGPSTSRQRTRTSASSVQARTTSHLHHTYAPSTSTSDVRPVACSVRPVVPSTTMPIMATATRHPPPTGGLCATGGVPFSQTCVTPVVPQSVAPGPMSGPSAPVPCTSVSKTKPLEEDGVDTEVHVLTTKGFRALATTTTTPPSLSNSEADHPLTTRTDDPLIMITSSVRLPSRFMAGSSAR